MEVENPYTPNNPESVFRLIIPWVQENGEKIARIIGLDYGWEAWLQADLGYHLAREIDRTNATLRRESFVYGPGDHRRVDLTIYGVNREACHHFEFKCQSPNESRANFLKGLQNDWQKLPDVWMKTKENPRLWAIGFWLDNDDRKPSPGFENWEFKDIAAARVIRGKTTNNVVVNMLVRTWYGEGKNKESTRSEKVLNRNQGR